jgi:hypothetical protein
VSPPRLTAGIAFLGALIAGVSILLVVELANGAASSVSPTVAKPCVQRAPFQGHGVDATVQRVVLEGLDGAACKLGTSREQLVLSLSPASRGTLRSNRRTVEAAIRGGLTHAIDSEAEQGRIPALLVPLLRRVVQKTPFDRLIRGGLSLSDLIG